MATSKRRLLSAGAVAAAAALALSACASGGTSAGTDTAGDTGESGDAGTETSAESVELNFHTWLPTQDQWPAIIEAFEKEHPDITVNFTRDEDFDAFRTNLDNEILAGETPDIYGIQAGAAFDDYAQYAMPVDDYASDWIAKVREEPLTETTTSDGVLSAVPILTAGQQFYLYNKTLMDQHDIALPSNYEELVDAAAKATAAGLTPWAMGAADAWHDVDFFVWLSNQYGEGGEIYKAAEGEIPWDSEALVEAAAAWQSLFTDGVFQQGALSTNTYPQARDDYFLAGNSIAFPTGSWHVGMTLVAPDLEQPGSPIEDDEVGMAEFPQIGPNHAGATSGVDFALAVSADADEATAAAASKFLEFMAVGEGQQIWVDMLQGFPVAKDISIHVPDDEPELGKESLKLVEDALADSKYSRKLNVSGWDSLENDLGIVLQNIGDGADPASELATLNR